jgi:hypothetical protein
VRAPYDDGGAVLLNELEHPLPRQLEEVERSRARLVRRAARAPERCRSFRGKAKRTVDCRT